jgi:ribosomal protein L2
MEGELPMPTGPRGERRPADVIGCAVKVAHLSVGMEAEALRMPSGRVRSGNAGAAARIAALSEDQRHHIAKKAANARWDK